jgi:cytochrome b pre-mRNA-processing protein 3
MFTWLANRSPIKRKARDLYGAVVAQAREPIFYEAFGVEDTPEGRYEMIALHLALALERLGQPDVADEDLRRETYETFITDLDDAMRQMGVGDPTVPKRVKNAARGAYDRGVTYGLALAQPDNEALNSALIAHVYNASETGPVDALATYVRRAASHLADIDPKALRAGEIKFPRPELLP